MKDKICLITGANSGIGFETAKSLCEKGATVILVCRTMEKAVKAIEEIRNSFPEAIALPAVTDLGSQADIRKLAEQIKADFSKIDVLINNAGSWFSEFKLTEDGIERQWAINHLAPFLLTHLLLPLLERAKNPRILNVSSDSHFHGKIHFDDVNLRDNYHGIRAYAQSKLANVLFTLEFDRRKGDSPISVFAVQPGLVKTDIGIKHTISFHALMWKLRRLGGKTPQKGAETSIYLASEEDTLRSGTYWDNCRPKTPSKNATNIETGSKLWDLSMQMSGIRDYFKTD